VRELAASYSLAPLERREQRRTFFSVPGAVPANLLTIRVKIPEMPRHNTFPLALVALFLAMACTVAGAGEGARAGAREEAGAGTAGHILPSHLQELGSPSPLERPLHRRLLQQPQVGPCGVVLLLGRGNMVLWRCGVVGSWKCAVVGSWCGVMVSWAFQAQASSLCSRRFPRVNPCAPHTHCSLPLFCLYPPVSSCFSSLCFLLAFRPGTVPGHSPSGDGAEV